MNTKEKRKITISYDDCPISPRENSNIGVFATQKGNYISPDEGHNDLHDEFYEIMIDAGDYSKSVAEHKKKIIKVWNKQNEDKVASLFIVSRYEHGNVRYYIGTGGCQFDSGVVGFYLVTENQLKESGLKKEELEDVIALELKEYTNWANGEVYRWEDGEDSCCGYYSIEDIKREFENEDVEFIENF